MSEETIAEQEKRTLSDGIIVLCFSVADFLNGCKPFLALAGGILAAKLKESHEQITKPTTGPTVRTNPDGRFPNSGS